MYRVLRWFIILFRLLSVIVNLLFRDSNGHNSVTVQNRTHVYMNFFDHKDLGNHLLQLCPKVVKHPVYIWLRNDCIWTVVVTNNTFVHKSRDIRSVAWRFFIEASTWRWLGEYVTVDKKFYNLLFKQELVAAPVTSTFCSLSYSTGRPLLEM